LATSLPENKCFLAQSITNYSRTPPQRFTKFIKWSANFVLVVNDTRDWLCFVFDFSFKVNYKQSIVLNVNDQATTSTTSFRIFLHCAKDIRHNYLDLKRGYYYLKILLNANY